MAKVAIHNFPQRTHTPQPRVSYHYEAWSNDYIDCLVMAGEWLKRQYTPRGTYDRTPKPICDEYNAMIWAIHAENVIAMTGGFND